MRRFSNITTTQLARICGVSQGTVDRALHNREGISQRTREYILDVAREYNYMPKVKGSTPARSMLIGVVLYDLYNEFFSKLAMSLINEAKRVGYSVIFQFSEKDPDNEKTSLEYFDYIGVDGIILFSVGSDGREYSNYLHSLKKPLVLIGNRMFDFCYIGIDDRLAMRDLSVRLAGQAPPGDILYYAPTLRRPLHSLNAQKLRLLGFTQAMQACGRSYRIVTDPEALSDFGGIVCSTDYYVFQALKHLNYPDEISIAGFDNISFLKVLSARILTVEYSTDEIAAQCLNYLLGKRFCDEISYRLVYNTDKRVVT